ncbi:MAG: hypothetical protein KAS72_09500 [Phycisphaerales bacterium]|nr:hypothetical protein [Phycisphaerales bacterium]
MLFPKTRTTDRVRPNSLALTGWRSALTRSGSQRPLALERLEDRRLLNGQLDHVTDIEVVRGQFYDGPGSDAEYIFMCSVELDAVGLLNGITLTTPNGTVVPITDMDQWAGDEEWDLEIESEDQADLANYGDGMYTLDFDFVTGPNGQIEVLFGLPGSGDPLPIPTQIPELTNPVDDATDVPLQTTFTWDVLSDANANTIVFMVEDETADSDVVNEMFDDTSTTTFGPVALTQDHEYEVELIFAYAVTDTTPDGGDILVATFVGMDTEFDTIPGQPAGVDLVGEFGAIRLPEQIVPGDKGKVTVIVTNNGTATARGAVRVNLYASDDQTLDGNDELMATVSKNVNLAAGKSKKFNAKVAIAADIEPGTYYILAQVDADGAIAETDEDNNIAVTDGTGEVVWKFGTFDGRRNVKFTAVDENGTTITMSIKGNGEGELLPDEDTADIVLTGTDANSSFVVKTKGGAGNVVVRDITVNGSLKALTAKTTDLGGDLVVTGSLAKLQLDDVADQHLISIGAAANPALGTKIKLDEVLDLTLTSDMPIKSLLVNSWLDQDATPDQITAPWITKLTSKGDFEASMTLSDATVDWSLKKMTVVGRLTGSVIRTVGSIGAITVGGITDSMIFAGVQDAVTDLPDVAGDFASEQAIRKFTVKPPAGAFSFVNSIVAAWDIGKISIGSVNPDNGGTPFGFAADRIRLYIRREGGVTTQLNKLDDPGIFDELTDYGIHII